MVEMAEFGRTAKVPWQLVSVRGNLDGAVVDDSKILLAGMDEPEEGGRLLKGLKNTTTFDAVPPVRCWSW